MKRKGLWLPVVLAMCLAVGQPVGNVWASETAQGTEEETEGPKAAEAWDTQGEAQMEEPPEEKALEAEAGKEVSQEADGTGFGSENVREGAKEQEDAAERPVVAQGTTAKNLNWVLYEDGELVISGQGTMGVERPWNEYGDKILTVTVEEGVKNIFDSAFYSCPNMTKIRIPASVVQIGDDSEVGYFGAFFKCVSLLEIEVAADNPVYSSKDGILYNKDKTEIVSFPAAIGGEYTIPSHVKKIWSDAFSDSNLTKISIPTTLKELGDVAFHRAESLEKVIFYGKPDWDGESIESSFIGANKKLRIYYSAEIWGYDMDMGKRWNDCVPSASKIGKVQTWGYDGVKLSWDRVNNAQGYRLYYTEGPGKPWKYLTQIGNGKATSYIHTGRVTGKTYTYYMRAYHSIEDGEKIFGAYSQGMSGKALPRAVQIRQVTGKSGSAAVNWDRVNGASGYRLYYRTSENGKWQYAAQIGKGNLTSYTHRGLKKGQKIYYKMRAYRTVDGEKVFGAYSGQKSVRIK